MNAPTNSPTAFSQTLSLQAMKGSSDIRPTLLKLATEQFLEVPHHVHVEAEQFGELACGFLRDAPLTLVMDIAERLVDRADIPVSLLQFFLNADPAVSSLMIERSPRLGGNSLINLAKNCPLELLVSLARRQKLAPEVVAAILARKDMLATAALIDNNTIMLPQEMLRPMVRVLAAEPKTLSRLMMRPEAQELSPLDFFLDAPSAMRMQALEDLVADADIIGDQPDLQSQPMKAAIAALESAAIARQLDLVVGMVAKAFGFSQNFAHQIVMDEGGEPLALMMKALAAPRASIERVMIFSPAAASRKPEELMELMGLINRLSVEDARALFPRLTRDGAMDETAEAAAAAQSEKSSETEESSKSASSHRKRSRLAGFWRP